MWPQINSGSSSQETQFFLFFQRSKLYDFTAQIFEVVFYIYRYNSHSKFVWIDRRLF